MFRSRLSSHPHGYLVVDKDKTGSVPPLCDKDKTEYMVMKNNKSEKEDIKIKVRKGEIGSTEKYKCVGDHYDITGSNENKVRKKMEKVKFMAWEIKRKGAASKVGYCLLSPLPRGLLKGKWRL